MQKRVLFKAFVFMKKMQLHVVKFDYSIVKVLGTKLYFAD